MKKILTFLFILLLNLGQSFAEDMFLGFDFLTRSLDGRYAFSDMIYGGIKWQPGMYAGEGGDINMDLEGFARFNLFSPAEGLAIGPEGGLRLIDNSEFDRAFLYGTFAVDGAFNIGGPVYLYGHLPFASLEIHFQGDNNFKFFVLGAHPVELGLMMGF